MCLLEFECAKRLKAHSQAIPDISQIKFGFYWIIASWIPGLITGLIINDNKTVPKNLIWSELAQWLLSSDVHKIPRAFFMPMGMPNMPPWAYDHNAAHLQAKTNPMNVIWSKSAQCLPSYGIRKFGAGQMDGRTDGRMSVLHIWYKYQVKLDAPNSAPTYLCSHHLAVIFLDR